MELLEELTEEAIQVTLLHSLLLLEERTELPLNLQTERQLLLPQAEQRVPAIRLLIQEQLAVVPILEDRTILLQETELTGLPEVQDHHPAEPELQLPLIEHIVQEVLNQGLILLEVLKVQQPELQVAATDRAALQADLIHHLIKAQDLLLPAQDLIHLQADHHRQDPEAEVVVVVDPADDDRL